jgi:hypothetical protein
MGIGDDVSIGTQNHTRANGTLAHDVTIAAVTRFAAQSITCGNDLHDSPTHASREVLD